MDGVERPDDPEPEVCTRGEFFVVAPPGNFSRLWGSWGWSAGASSLQRGARLIWGEALDGVETGRRAGESGGASIAIPACVLGCASFDRMWASEKEAGLAEGVRGAEVSDLSSERAPESELPSGFWGILRCRPGSKEVEVCMELPACFLMPGMDLFPPASPLDIPWLLLSPGDTGLHILEGCGFSGSGSFSLGVTAESLELGMASFDATVVSLELGTASLGEVAVGTASLGEVAVGTASLGEVADSLELGTASLGEVADSLELGTASLGEVADSLELGTASLGEVADSLELGTASLGEVVFA